MRGVNEMRALGSVIAILLAVVWSGARLEAGSQKDYGADLTAEVILKGLTEKQGEDLHEFITFLDYTFDKSNLTDQEIDQIVARLLVIQASDPFEKLAEGKGGTGMVFPNRAATAECIFRFRFQKIANSLLKLPIQERVSRILDGIDHPPKGLGYDTGGSFSAELVRAGREAVPFMIDTTNR
jgi:hypothetical protein